MKFFPHERGGGGISHAKGGGGAKSFYSLKGGGAQNVLPFLEGRGGGGTTSLDPAILPLCSPPLLANN